MLPVALFGRLVSVEKKKEPFFFFTRLNRRDHAADGALHEPIFARMIINERPSSFSMMAIISIDILRKLKIPV